MLLERVLYTLCRTPSINGCGYNSLSEASVAHINRQTPTNADAPLAKRVTSCANTHVRQNPPKVPNHVIAMTSVGLNVTMMESHNALHLLYVIVVVVFVC